MLMLHEYECQGRKVVLTVVCLCLLEMAEHHDAAEILRIARDLVYKVQTLIENK